MLFAHIMVLGLMGKTPSTKLDSLGMRATLLSQHVVDIIAIACDFVFLIKRQLVRIEGGLAGPQVLYNCFEKPVLRQPNIYISMSFIGFCKHYTLLTNQISGFYLKPTRGRPWFPTVTLVSGCDMPSLSQMTVEVR